MSVIIPGYNAARYIAAAIDSLLGQTHYHREIIFIDDGSNDNTEEVLAPYFGKIRYYRQSNHGLSATRNRAIALAQGKLLAFLDADDIRLPEKLTRQVDCLMRNRRIGMGHTSYLKLFDTTGVRLAHPPQAIKGGSCYTTPMLRNLVQVSSVVLRRACLE